MDQNVRNIIIVAGVVILALVVLGFISNLLSSILPLTIVAVVAFVLGRMSTRMNLMSVAGDFVTKRLLGSLLGGGRSASKKPAKKEQPAAKPVTKPAAQEVAVPVDPAPNEVTVEERLADPVDFEIKTTEQLQAEARRLEEEVAQRNTEYDARAAIEERKRRLLGDSDQT